MKNFKGVIFDMDGVIFDTERVYLETWKKVFKKYNYEMKDNIYVSVMGTGRKNVKKTFLDNYGQDLPIEEMYEERDELFYKIIDEGNVPLKDGAKEILEFLKKNGYKVALATSALRTRAEKQLEMGDLFKYFDAVICGDDVKYSKPNPDIFLKASESIDIEPEKCIVIEDSKAGINAAYNAKMSPIHVEDLKKADEDIKRLSKTYLKNLHEVKNFISNEI